MMIIIILIIYHYYNLYYYINNSINKQYFLWKKIKFKKKWFVNISSDVQ